MTHGLAPGSSGTAGPCRAILSCAELPGLYTHAQSSHRLRGRAVRKKEVSADRQLRAVCGGHSQHHFSKETRLRIKRLVQIHTNPVFNICLFLYLAPNVMLSLGALPKPINEQISIAFAAVCI